MYMFYTCASLIGNNNNSNNNNNNNSCYGYIAPGNAGRNWPLTWRDVETSAKRKPATSTCTLGYLIVIQVGYSLAAMKSPSSGVSVISSSTNVYAQMAPLNGW